MTYAEIRADRLDFEIAVARLYVQHKLSTIQIADRLCVRSNRVAAALHECGIAMKREKTWAV